MKIQTFKYGSGDNPSISYFLSFDVPRKTSEDDHIKVAINHDSNFQETRIFTGRRTFNDQHFQNSSFFVFRVNRANVPKIFFGS